VSRRKNALPETDATGIRIERCLSCDNSPAYLCPGCPKRPRDGVYKFDHGWRCLTKHDAEMAQLEIRSAKAAREIATLHEAHPAYPRWEREYQDAGVAIARMRAQRHGLADPFRQ
jgi:hypothetical protein